MNHQTEILLQTIGEDLDQRVFPTVHDSGLVWPARTVVISQPPGQEIENERQTNALGSWQAGASTASGTSCNAGPARASPSLPRRAFERAGAVRELEAAYPGTEVTETREAVWLRIPATLLPNLGYRAIFVVVIIPELRIARGWAFWDYGIWGLQRIGPRHTNYGDASICAFDDRDGTWSYGDSLVAFLDLFTVWAVRHLYLREFGRWPGPQASFSPFERLRECHDDESCGCDHPKGRYAICCKDGDYLLAARAKNKNLTQILLPRSIPTEVSSFAARMASPPSITYDGLFPLFGESIS